VTSVLARPIFPVRVGYSCIHLHHDAVSWTGRRKPYQRCWRADGEVRQLQPDDLGIHPRRGRPRPAAAAAAIRRRPRRPLLIRRAIIYVWHRARTCNAGTPSQVHALYLATAAKAFLPRDAYYATRRWHVTISCQPDGRPPQPVRPWKNGRVHLADGSNVVVLELPYSTEFGRESRKFASGVRKYGKFDDGRWQTRRAAGIISR